MKYEELNEKVVTMVGSGSFCDGLTILREKNRLYAAPAVSNPKKIGYFTEQKIDKCNDSGYFFLPYTELIREKFGIMTKPGKFFKHCLPDSTDKDIQKMVAEYYTMINEFTDISKSDFHLSNDIKKYYHSNIYEGYGGSLGNSCMKHTECQDYLTFYENYNVKILVLKSGDKIKGRALIWENVNFPGLCKTLDFMDRIYVNNDNDIELFKSYADKHNIVHKYKQSYNDKETFVYQQQQFEDHIIIEQTNSLDIDSWPYVDTMANMDDNGNLCNISTSEYYINLEETDGSNSETIGRAICEDCGNRFDSENEGIYVENHGHVCDNCQEEYSYCEDCDTYSHYDNGSYVEDEQRFICDSCLSEDYYCCEACNNYHKYDKDFEHDYSHYCRECFDELSEQCEDCNCIVDKDDIKCYDDNEYLCSDCYNDRVDAEETEEVA